MATSLTRQELYDLVWSKPISKLVEHFGVSGVAIAKACSRAHVPVPPRGWWARRTAGQSSIVRVQLGQRPPGLDDTVTVGGGAYAHYYRGYAPDQEILNSPIPPEPSFEEDIDAVRERVMAMVGKVSVPRSLVNPHPLVARLLEQDDARREKQRTSAYVSSWDAPKFDSPIERRRLRILSTALSTLARCGCRIDGRTLEGRVFSVRVGHQHMNVALVVEEHRTRKRAGSAADPSVEKRLRFTIGVSYDGSGEGSRSWDDGTMPLEDQVRDIAVEMVVHAEAAYRKSVLWGHGARKERKAQLEEAARQAAAEAIRKERERQERLEKERVERLLGEAASLARAREIRRYVEEVRDANAASADPLPPERIDAWSDWALQQADRIDPVRSGAFRKPYDEDTVPTTA